MLNLKKKKIINLEKLKINFSYSFDILKIYFFEVSPRDIYKILVFFFNELKYFFYYLKYEIVINNNSSSKINKKTINELIFLILNNPFLWEEEYHLKLIINNEIIFKKVFINNSFLYLCNKENYENKKLFSLFEKKLIKISGLENIFPIIKKILEEKKYLNLIEDKKKEKIDEKKLLIKWKERKLYELGIHTNFSNLDGISTPSDYIKNAKKKNYSFLGVTDHYNVQSFPEFSKIEDKDLRIIYGCELEMIEDNFSFPFFNINDNEIFNKKINEIKYCLFDLETTGLFSEYNEIIEIGYIIYYQGKILEEKEYLICPENEIEKNILENWYTNINPEELKKSPKLSKIIPILQEKWKDCILVAHNAKNFDYGFLKKIWKKNSGEELKNSIIDTLILSWILIPGKKKYSLEKLSQLTTKEKQNQLHRALDDSRLLLNFFKKIIKIIEEKQIYYWKDINTKNNIFFPGKGLKIKVIVKNQKGLENLYNLITISHTKNLFKRPCLFRSDIINNRSGLFIGSSGSKDGEIFRSFNSFFSEKEREKKIKFYDYIEIGNPNNFNHLQKMGKISEKNLNNTIKKILKFSEKLGIITFFSHNVHYCKKKEKILKEIIVANEGIKGYRHYLYNELMMEKNEDKFSELPDQYLPELKEIIKMWKFIENEKIIEDNIFFNKEKIIKNIEKIEIKHIPINYSKSNSIEKKKEELIKKYVEKTDILFGKKWPIFVHSRINEEWKIIKDKYIFIYWLSYKIVEKAHQDESIVGSRGSIGSSFIAYLCEITDLNPLPFYKFCKKCKFSEIYKTEEKNYSCYDYLEKENCPNCSNYLIMEGHNLPFETFFGWEGEKTPDIDLNFSGEYQKIAHEYVGILLGRKSYRIGTISTLSKKTAETFYDEHLKMRKKINSLEYLENIYKKKYDEDIPEWKKKYIKKINLDLRKKFDEEKWYSEWIDNKKIEELQNKKNELIKKKNSIIKNSFKS